MANHPRALKGLITSMRCLFLLVSLVLVGGCATNQQEPFVNDPSELPSIQVAYAARLSQLKIGQSLQEFQGMFPEAIPAGQSGGMTAYELIHTQ